MFEEEEIREYVAVYQHHQSWVDRGYVATVFKVKESVVAKWVNLGLIAPVAKHASKYYFNRERILEFRANHVFSSTAANILGVNVLTVQKWARKGRLKPVAGPGIDLCHQYLFNKNDLIAWLDANYLTGTAYADYCGISHTQLLQLVKQGRVKPVSGPGVDDCGHYLFIPTHLIDATKD